MGWTENYEKHLTSYVNQAKKKALETTAIMLLKESLYEIAKEETVSGFRVWEEEEDIAVKVDEISQGSDLYVEMISADDARRLGTVVLKLPSDEGEGKLFYGEIGTRIEGKLSRLLEALGLEVSDTELHNYQALGWQHKKHGQGVYRFR